MKSPIISMFSLKGGSGKTLTTANLAVTLKDLGYKVLVVDMDPQASISKLFEWTDIDENNKPKFTIGDLLLLVCKLQESNQFTDKTKENLFDVINSVIFNSRFGVDLLPSSKFWDDQLDEISSLNVSSFVKLKLLREILNIIRNKYDLILIDTTPSKLDSPLSLSLGASTFGFIISKPDLYILDSNSNSLNFGREVIQNFNPQFKFGGILVNDLDRRCKADRIALDLITNNALDNKIQVLTNYIPHRSIIKDINPECLIACFIKTKKTAEIRKIFEDVAKEILTKVGIIHD